MAALRILIVDDEPLARERLRAFLQRDPSVNIIGECGSGPEAVAVIRRDEPDIVFLDLQMPGFGGLQVVAEIPPDRRPAIIFVTAHEQFAVEAFAAQATDYLLKPFDADRLQQALKRARDYLGARRNGDLATRLESLLETAAARGPERLAFKADGRVVFLRPDEIVWIEAANNYCILHLADAKPLMLRETLASLEEQLGAINFARVNRSAMVHINQVKELQPAKYGDYLVVLRNGLRLSLSRNLRGRLERFVPGPP
jgi:two-component system LytT family response regulator